MGVRNPTTLMFIDGLWFCPYNRERLVKGWIIVGKTMEHHDSEANRPIERICRGTWRVANSPWAVLVMLVLLLMMAVLGGLSAQARSGVLGEMSRLGQAVQGEMAQWATSEVLGSFGLQVILRSWLFRVFVGVAVAIIVLRMLGLWVSSWPTTAVELVPSLNVVLPLDEGATWKRVSHVFGMMGQRETRRIEIDDSQYALYKRVGKKRWLGGMFYLGLLVLMLASLIRTHYGWNGSPVDLALGESRVLDPRSGLTVRLEQIALLPRADGTLQRFDSRIALLEKGRADQELDVGFARRAVYGGTTIYQLGFGPAARLSVQQGDGTALNLQQMLSETEPRHVLRVRFSERQQEQLVAVPEAGLIVRLIQYPNASREERGTLHVEVLRGQDGVLIAEQFLTDAGTITTNGIVVHVAPEYHVTLRAEREPELPLAALGGVLVVLGMCGLIVWPPRENWVSISKAPGGSRCRFFASPADAGAQWLRHAHKMIAEEGDE